MLYSVDIIRLNHFTIAIFGFYCGACHFYCYIDVFYCGFFIIYWGVIFYECICFYVTVLESDIINLFNQSINQYCPVVTLVISNPGFSRLIITIQIR